MSNDETMNHDTIMRTALALGEELGHAMRAGKWDEARSVIEKANDFVDQQRCPHLSIRHELLRRDDGVPYVKATCQKCCEYGYRPANLDGTIGHCGPGIPKCQSPYGDSRP